MSKRSIRFSFVAATLALSWGLPTVASSAASSSRVPGFVASPSADYFPANSAHAVAGVQSIDAVEQAAIGQSSASTTGTATTRQKPGSGTPPSAPGTPTLTAGVGSISAAWTAPTSTGTSAIKNYVVQYSANSGGTWTTASSSVTTLSYTINSLLAANSYIVQVAAVNSTGQGPYSSPSAPASPTAAAPNAPGTPTVTAGTLSVTVKWSAPSANGAAISSYAVRFSSDNGSTWTTANSTITTTSYTVNNLSSTTSYVFGVSATNSVGTSAWSPNSAAVTPSAGTTNNGISYHNGPVMTNTINVYTIWYGDWSGAAARQTVINNFLQGVGGSSYFNINTTYYNASNVKVPNSVVLAGSTNVAATSLSLAQSDITTIVNNVLTSGALPTDANGLYYVLTAANVAVSGFLTQYCGYHSYGTMNGKTIKYSMVGDPSANTGACVSGNLSSTSSPNADWIGDGMVSVIVHELEETASDPQLNAWYDAQGNENGDKCAWNFGTVNKVPTGTASNAGANYNVIFATTINGVTTNYYYLVQQNWVNAGGGYCGLSY